MLSRLSGDENQIENRDQNDNKNLIEKSRLSGTESANSICKPNFSLTYI